MVIMIVKYEICERSTHDGYISLGINNKYKMIGAEIIGEFCCSSVGNRTILHDVGDKNRRIREQQLLRFFDDQVYFQFIKKAKDFDSIMASLVIIRNQNLWLRNIGN